MTPPGERRDRLGAPRLIDSSLERVLGARSARALGHLELRNVNDLLTHYPRRYAHWGKLTPLASIRPGDDVTLLARVVDIRMVANRRGGVRLCATLTDGVATIEATFFAGHPAKLSVHQRLLIRGSEHLFAGKVTSYRGQLQLTHPQFEQVDDEDHAKERAYRPLPIYPASASCPTWMIERCLAIVLDQITSDDIDDPIPDDLRQREGLLPLIEALRLIHRPNTDDDVTAAKRTVRWAEALELQVALAQRRHRMDCAQAIPIAMDVDQAVRRANLSFQLTGGQRQALIDIATDLHRDHPMQRLLEADVGAGKTVVAAIAMQEVVDAGYQAAMLAPTQVLAEQHAASLAACVNVPVELLTASSAQATKRRLAAFALAGEPMIVVATHALLYDTVDMSRLALVVVDEQHRFGVAQRERLREGGETTPHLLMMTATPIPRTVAMTVFGDLDVSRMTELPSGRTRVQTFVIDDANHRWMSRLWERAREEIDAGRRVFVVVPRIDSDTGESDDAELAAVESTAQRLRSLPVFDGIEVATLHGQMRGEDKTRIVEDFGRGRTPLLVSTTVVEVGVDVADASMMVILDAQQFGLSQLHQLRGRVGRRAGIDAVCMAVHRHDISPASKERLDAFARTTDGFELAEIDVSLRREGDVLGDAQSGKRTSLKALRVMRDTMIIQRARDAARAIVDEDPTLSQHPQLARRIYRDSDELDWMRRT